MKYDLKILLAAAILVLASCGTDAIEEISISGSWDLIGFEGENIQFVRSEGSVFYLATDTEIYRSEDLLVWTSQNMGQILKEGEKVRDFLVFSESEILGVVLFKDEISSEEREQYWDNFVSLFRTTDGGESWEPLFNEFTENGAFVGQLSADAGLQNTYAVHGGNVARSDDRGQSWTPAYWHWDENKWEPGTNSRFIKVNPFNPNVIWSGGINVAGQGYAIRSLNSGTEWEFIFPPGNEGGTQVNDVIYLPGSPNNVLLGLLDSIQLTPDSGQTWERVYEGVRVLTLENGTITDEAVYASGRLFEGSDAGKLFLIFTPNFGSSWQTFIYEDGPDDMIVNDLAVVEINGQETVLLATNRGLYSFSVE